MKKAIFFGGVGCGKGCEGEVPQRADAFYSYGSRSAYIGGGGGGGAEKLLHMIVNLHPLTMEKKLAIVNPERSHYVGAFCRAAQPGTAM